MQLHFTTKNIEMTDALQKFTQEKFEKLTRRHANVSKVNVTLIVEKADQIAEATAHYSGAEIHASAKSSDMYTSIDLLIDKLISQISKHKDKQTAHHR